MFSKLFLQTSNCALLSIVITITSYASEKKTRNRPEAQHGAKTTIKVSTLKPTTSWAAFAGRLKVLEGNVLAASIDHPKFQI
jgi:hypothetical protein